MYVPDRQKVARAWKWTAALGVLAVFAVSSVVWLTLGPPDEARAASFVVNSLADTPDLGDVAGTAGSFNPGDTANGTCDTDPGPAVTCTLRAAVFEANGNGDVADTITFGTLSGTITIGTSLPVGDGPGIGDGFSDATTIDSNGSITVMGPGPLSICFDVFSASNVIRDLSITGCDIGVQILGEAADGNALRGNTIFGHAGFLGAGVGIYSSADSNTVGGTSTADRNIIRNNAGNGVEISDAGTSGNMVIGNCIGTLPGCSTAAPNGVDGVSIALGADGTTVGGVGVGAGNVIAFNGDDGVDITAGAGSGSVVTRNVMFLNGHLGIENAAVPAPAITGCADAGGGMAACSGTSGGPGRIIEVYRANVDASGPEGDLFLCSAVAGGGGAWGCSFSNPGGGSATATQRDPAGANNTSPFSGAVGIPASPPITATPTPTFTPTRTATPVGTLTPTRTSTPVGTLTSTPTRTPTPGSPTVTPTRTPTRTATPSGPAPTATSARRQAVSLVAGCQIKTFIPRYPAGTSLSSVAADISGGNPRLWFQRPGTFEFDLFDPTSGERTTVSSLIQEAGFICVDTAATWNAPALG